MSRSLFPGSALCLDLLSSVDRQRSGTTCEHGYLTSIGASKRIALIESCIEFNPSDRRGTFVSWRHFRGASEEESRIPPVLPDGSLCNKDSLPATNIDSAEVARKASSNTESAKTDKVIRCFLAGRLNIL